jgi:hypothetical protein
LACGRRARHVAHRAVPRDPDPAGGDGPVDLEEDLTIVNPGMTRLAAIVPALIGLGVRPCRADDAWFSPTVELVRISLGAMHVSSATTLQADSSANTAGSVIDGEGRFGLDRSDFEPKFQAMVRIAVRQRVSFDYFTLDRSGSTTLAGPPIVFKDVTLLPGDPLRTRLSLRSLGITYGYSFVHSDTLELAATFGVHSTDISAAARVQSAARNVDQSQDVAGPVPTLGLDGTWVVSRRFYLDARVEYLGVHVGNVDGSLGIYEFDALYRYRPNVSFAAGYTEFKAHLSSTRNAQGGLFDCDSRGPVLFIRIAF